MKSGQLGGQTPNQHIQLAVISVTKFENTQGSTALDLAKREGYKEIVELLKQN